MITPSLSNYVYRRSGARACACFLAVWRWLAIPARSVANRARKKGMLVRFRTARAMGGARTNLRRTTQFNPNTIQTQNIYRSSFYVIYRPKLFLAADRDQSLIECTCHWLISESNTAQPSHKNMQYTKMRYLDREPTPSTPKAMHYGPLCIYIRSCIIHTF